MRLHNTLTHQISDFKPLQENQITIYSCGPTVYDRAHIGNLSSFIYADTLKRTLKYVYPEATIKHVMNITDIDDKTIKRSQEKYPDLEPREALEKLTRYYEASFMDDLEAVGINTKSIDFIRATDSIGDMQSLIQQLLDSGMAYLNDDGIYFSIDNYKKAGKKYGQLIEITEASSSEARIDNDEYDKDNVHDFALWKVRKPNEPSWDFEIDGKNLTGRPGWHIECSAMSVKSLGQPFDIHTGGVDLIFPHHENEIAQSTAASENNLLANFFIHSEHLLIEGNKMSKSLNNFYTLQDILDKSINPLAFRLLVLEGQYRGQRNFSWPILESSNQRLKHMQNFASQRFQFDKSSESNGIDLELDLASSLSDDLNTPDTLQLISGYMESIEQADIGKDEPIIIEKFAEQIDSLLGLGLLSLEDIEENLKQLINDREAARTSQDWARSDQIRDELKEQGIGVNDTDLGPIWYRL